MDQRVAVTIWKLATTMNFKKKHYLHEQFGIGKTTDSEIVNETCQQLVLHLLPKYVRIPNGERLKE